MQRYTFENLHFERQPSLFTRRNSSYIFGLSSPQHSIAGFVIDLDASQGRGVSLDASKLGESKIGIKFKALLKLVADVDFVPKAEVEFSVFGKFGMKDGRPDWKGFDADINKIKLEAGAKIGPVGVEGTLGYYNDNNKPNANYGFFGSLIMNIDKLITIEAKDNLGIKKKIMADITISLLMLWQIWEKQVFLFLLLWQSMGLWVEYITIWVLQM